jgi:hypothetical protein
MDRRSTDENDIVNAIVLNPVTLQEEPFATTVLTPTRNFNFSIRTDYLATKKFTLGGQYRFFKTEALNQGLGSSFDLPERAFNRSSREDTVRFSLMTIASEHAVNETRLQFSRRKNEARAVTDAPAIMVQDAFNSGGNQNSLFTDNSTRDIEFTNDTTYTYKKHTLKFGFRAEGERLETFSRSNFGGTFTFFSLDQYRRVLEGVPGVRPAQFTITEGDPATELSQWEMGWFLQDDWKIANNLTLSYGIRHEFQTHLQDKLNFAPRFGITWVPDKKQMSTIRAGGGIFYNRLNSGITYDTIRLDGQHQLQYTVTGPDFFPDIPEDLTGAIARQPTIRVKDEELNAPYTMMASVGYERRLPKNIFASVNYSWQRGVHLLRTRNINAPIGIEQGEDGENMLILPFPGQGPILQYESSGFSNSHVMRTMLRTNLNPRYSLFGSYVLSSIRSDTDGAGSTPANQYDVSNEYGRAGMDARHQVFFGGSVSLPWNVRVNPMIHIMSGRPFNITIGRDNNLDTLFADRPGFGIPGEPNTVVTPFGVFKLNPLTSDAIIPRNFGEGPGMFSANLNISKTFGFGPALGGPQNRVAQGGQQSNQQGNTQANQQGRGGNRGDGGGRGNRGGGDRGGMRPGGGGPGMVAMGGGGMRGGGGGFFGGGDARRKYNMTVSISVSNLLNHTNFQGYIGTLSSPFFGTANRAARERRIDAALRFNF